MSGKKGRSLVEGFILDVGMDVEGDMRDGTPYTATVVEINDRSRATLKIKTPEEKKGGIWGIIKKSDGTWGSDMSFGELRLAVPPKIKAKISWDSVILPEDIKRQIMATLAQEDNRDKIFSEWGFEDVLEKGSGLTMLFDGPPGTGKTLAAEAIADHVNKPLQILNTGHLQSMFVGECEKNIIKAFRVAKEKDMVLLFDEAEGMLHDRDRVTFWARGQTGVLLTCLERHEGIVIFTTNRVQDLDRALERRISLKLTFPLPDKTARAAIWRRMIPSQCPLDKDVDLDSLAEIELSGGDIKNIVLNAAREAAYGKSDCVKLEHFFHAIEIEKKSQAHFKNRRSERERKFGSGRMSGWAPSVSPAAPVEGDSGSTEGEPAIPPSVTDGGGKVMKTRARHQQGRPHAF